jgi:hypothetical protein
MWLFRTKIGRIILTCCIGLVLCTLIFFVVSANSKRIISAYNQLGGKPTASKIQFATKYATVIQGVDGAKDSISFIMNSNGSDGSITITDSGLDPSKENGDEDLNNSEDGSTGDEDPNSGSLAKSWSYFMDYVTPCGAGNQVVTSLSYTYVNDNKETVNEEVPIYLYDGPPWPVDNTYSLNIDKVANYVEPILSEGLTYNIHYDGNCSEDLQEVDGVMCVDAAGYPILGFCDINDAGDPVAWSVATRPRKWCAVLKDASGKKYYLPLTCKNDAKGHCWPGGVSQTMLSVQTSKGYNNWYFNSDSGTITGNIIGVTINDLSTITNGYPSVLYQGADPNPYINLECKSKYAKALNANFELVGFMSWKE